MKKNIVKINEDTLNKIISESTKKVLNEGLGDFIMRAKEARYYFTNHDRWIKRANKIAESLEGLLSYLDENGEDEDCKNIEQAISLVDRVITSLETYRDGDNQ